MAATTLRFLLFAALSATAALGAAARLHIAAIGRVRAQANPDAAATLFQLATGAGDLAPGDASGNSEWPCFTGNATVWPDCSSIPAGALVIGQPMYTVSLAKCTASTTVPCVWLYYIVDDEDTGTLTGLDCSIKVTQGSAVIFDTGTMSYGPNAPNLYIVSANVAFGPGNCPSTETCVAPAAGTAKITATTSVGQYKAIGETTIEFQ
ncbi:MAG: hypothetical protein ABSF64_29590 [Bryobacteraceae bacterium]|jgi:hypothetical protein